ncbi:MAG: 1-acyl-sn-glycerol-3-phosphate acyltransferase [Actinomycetia bacterium]|nr:1-acyl-sn-glycerol-3-phosphate acyltransferase [Actinomycetes bacterium]
MADRWSLAPRTIHRTFRLPTRMLVDTYFDLSVKGRSNIPSDGPAVIAANHFSHLDPPLISMNIDRYARFLAVDGLFGQSKLFDLMMSFWEAIPLDRDGYPVRAMRTAVDHVLGGNVVGLFPEGRRVERWGEDPPKRGAAWLAWMTGAPLIPITIHGTKHSLAPGERGFHRTAVRMWIDEPLWWYNYVNEIDPLGAMIADWYEIVDGHLAPWEADE